MKFDMNVGIVKNLSKLCCVCFGEGEFDVREYTVKLTMDDETSIPGLTMSDRVCNIPLEEEFNALHMLEPFKKKKEPDLSQDHDLPLICQICVDELISSFLFYRKVQRADNKLSDILFSNTKMETDLTNEEAIGVEYLVEDLEEDDSPVVDNELKEPIEEIEYNKSNFDYSNKLQLDEEIEIEIESEKKTDDIVLKHGIKRKMGKQPTIVLTGGVSHMPSHIKTGVPKTTQKCIPQTTKTHSSQKRLKTQREKYQPLEEGSFVVAQFIPSSTEIHMETIYPNEEHQGNLDFPISCNELRTMDFAAVEIESSAELQINEADTSISNNKINNNVATGNSGPSGENSSQPVYVCKYCPQAFSASHFLITHVRKSHVCKFCTLAFNKSTDLYEHIRSEHNEHKCAICGKELSTHSNLRSHIKRVHGVKLPAQVALLDYRRRSALDVQNEEVQPDDITNSNLVKIEEVEEQEVCIEFENDGMEFIKHPDDIEKEKHQSL